MTLIIPIINSIITDYLSDDSNKTEVNSLVKDTLTTIFTDCLTFQDLEKIELERYLRGFGSDPNAIDNSTIDQIFQDLMKSPAFNDFFNGIAKSRKEAKLRPMVARFFELNHAGHANPATGEIAIESRLDRYVKRSVMIFEMAHIAQLTKFDKITEDMDNGTIKDRVEYARRIELIEFESAKIHNRIIRQSIEHGSMDQVMLKYVYYDDINFEQYWELMKGCNHATRQMENYDRMMKNKTV